MKELLRQEYADKMSDECYNLYVNYHQSMKEVAENLMISKPTVKFYLDRIGEYDIERYVLYRNEVKKRRSFPK